MLARAIERRFPGTRVVVDRYTPPDRDYGIRWYVRILNCPARVSPWANKFAVERAFELWGGMGFPFFVGAYTRRSSRRFLPERSVRARARRAPASRALASARSRRARSRRSPV
ncbi:MAG TPA: hypothetical protein VKF62_02325 [Planctomycetota bacterium]|nr:hypothetical protein [Planctomycetota bacterium]